MSASAPQAQSVPSDLIAKPMKSPRPTSTQFVSDERRVGVRMNCALAPNWTSWCPQNQRLPSDCWPTLSILLAQILTQLVEEPTCTGTVLLLVEPVPRTPAQLLPQAHRVPFFFKARQCKPVATCFQSLPGTERTGVERGLLVLPTCQE